MDSADFERDGFVILRQAIPADDIEALKLELEELYAEDIHHQREVTETGLWGRLHAAERLWRLPQLAECARTLLGAERLRLWQDQVIIKKPRSGSSTEWHQDAPYWPMSDPRALTCWIPLAAVDEDRGALRFVPGSHTWDMEPHLLPRSHDDLKAAVRAGILTVALQVGDCTLHGGRVVHGACPNKAETARLAYKFVYMADGVSFRFQWHGATQGLELRDGDVLQGPQFPLVV